MDAIGMPHNPKPPTSSLEPSARPALRRASSASLHILPLKARPYGDSKGDEEQTLEDLLA
jgi:hypothetical protein